QIEACFDAILERTTETFRRELLAKIPDGTYVWEDYAEHDGVDPPRLHTQRMTLTKRDDRLIIDFAGTSPHAKGPINHAGDYADGVFLKKWLAPILRILAGVIAKAVGGRMPADQETIRYTGFHGADADGQFYLMREVLGGGSGGRFYADGSD